MLNYAIHLNAIHVLTRFETTFSTLRRKELDSKQGKQRPDFCLCVQQNYMYGRMSQTEIGSQYEIHSTDATQTKDKEPIVKNCENGCQNTEFEVPCNCTVSQSRNKQSEPKPNRKRKKKRYLKQLSSKVGIQNDPSSATENRKHRALSEAGEALGSGSPFIYCRFIVKFPILAFCKYAKQIMCNMSKWSIKVTSV